VYVPAERADTLPLFLLHPYTYVILCASASHSAELVFLNFYGAQESIPRIDSGSLCSLAGRCDNPIPTRFLASIDFSKIPALYPSDTHKGDNW
jgi:hypothetical protein